MKIRDSRQKEWFWLDNEYLNGYAKHLGASCTVVYLSLCRHADNKTQTCFPSMKLIAEENGISTKTVERVIKKLESWSIISIIREKGEDGKQKVNVYTLLGKEEWKNKPTDNKSLGKTDRQNDTEPTDTVSKNRQTPVPCNYTHINKTQLTRLNSKTIVLQGNQWNQLIDSFEPINPMFKSFYKNTTERKALQELVDQLGYDKVVRMLATLPEIVERKYAPKITKPSELKRDLGKLVLFYKQEQNNNSKYGGNKIY